MLKSITVTSKNLRQKKSTIEERKMISMKRSIFVAVPNNLMTTQVYTPTLKTSTKKKYHKIHSALRWRKRMFKTLSVKKRGNQSVSHFMKSNLTMISSTSLNKLIYSKHTLYLKTQFKTKTRRFQTIFMPRTNPASNHWMDLSLTQLDIRKSRITHSMKKLSFSTLNPILSK